MLYMFFLQKKAKHFILDDENLIVKVSEFQVQKMAADLMSMERYVGPVRIHVILLLNRSRTDL